MMNETLLREIAGDAELVRVEELATARTRLMAAIESENPQYASARRKSGSWRTLTNRRSLLAGGFASVVAAAIVGTVVLMPSSGNDGAAQAEPALILDRAAAAAQSTPAPRANQFLYVKDSSGESWYSIDGIHDGAVDRDGVRLPIPGCRNGRRATVKGETIVPGVTEACTADPAYLPDAPTDTAGMTGFLAARGGKGAPNSIGKAAVDLLSNHLLPGASKAALFHVIAAMPGLTIVHDATDAAGRSGIGVAWTFYGQTEAIIFDAHTYAYLGMGSGATGADVLVTSKVVDHIGDRK